jgi:hypothetical protein
MIGHYGIRDLPQHAINVPDTKHAAKCPGNQRAACIAADTTVCSMQAPNLRGRMAWQHVGPLSQKAH